MTEDQGLHNRGGLGDDDFYVWLLSDHPDARAERDRRRDATYRDEAHRSGEVRAWVDKVNATQDAPQTMRDLAESMGPLADRSSARAEADFSEPNDAYVARLRNDWETYMQVSGPLDAHDYRYPEHLIGPGAAKYPPPQVQADSPEQPEAGL
jgi:hypothetical protein